MQRNRVQFQKGLSLGTFLQRYGSEPQPSTRRAGLVACPATKNSGALPQMRMLPACLTEMLPLVFREPGGIGLKRAWQCAPLQADSSFLVVCGPTT